MNRIRARHPADRRPIRRGTIALEFLCVFPIVMVFVLAIVEFGIVLANVKQVEMAAYEGAKTASRLERSDFANGVDRVERRVNRSLHTANIGPVRGVVLRHNVPGAGRRRQQRWNGPPRDFQFKPLPRNRDVAAVQCTVCVPLSQLGPDLLPFVGFTLKNRYATATKTLPHVR